MLAKGAYGLGWDRQALGIMGEHLYMDTDILWQVGHSATAFTKDFTWETAGAAQEC